MMVNIIAVIGFIGISLFSGFILGLTLRGNPDQDPQPQNQPAPRGQPEAMQ